MSLSSSVSWGVNRYEARSGGRNVALIVTLAPASDRAFRKAWTAVLKLPRRSSGDLLPRKRCTHAGPLSSRVAGEDAAASPPAQPALASGLARTFDAGRVSFTLRLLLERWTVSA